MYDKFAILLERSGKSAYQVAHETGIATSTLTSWKQGKYTPKIDKLMKLAKYFGVPIEYFLEGG